MARAPSPPEIRNELDAVFRRSEFRERDTDRLWEYIERFFAWLGGLYDNDPLLFWLILLGCLTLLALLLWHIVWTMRRVFVMPTLTVDSSRRERELRSAAYAREADAQAETGDYTEAIRCLFLALVYRFDESGKVRFDQAYTNHEYLDLVADRDDIRQALSVFVELLDVHWYGERPTSRAEYDTCRRLYDGLSQGAGS